MKKIILSVILAFISIFSVSLAFAYDDPFITFLNKLRLYTHKYAQEKVYLHLDKPYYAIGDNIWFKAYVVNSVTQEPSTMSKILYVELINEKDSIAQQLKLPLNSGITWGDFKLTDSLKEGNYRIRSYTQWMRNAGTAFFYDKTIKIGNSWANKVFVKATNTVGSQNNVEEIKSVIRFTDKQNNPYANCNVSYEVKYSGKNLHRGKGITDTNGELTVNFVNKQPNTDKNLTIHANITLPNKQLISKEISIAPTAKETDIQFFAEGGKIVENLPGKIGFKAIGSNGLGEMVSGVVVTSQGQELIHIESNALGMGSFYLNPVPGETYKAIIKLKNGATKTLALPKAEGQGTVLSVNNLDDKKLTIKTFFSDRQINTGTYYLLLQHNGSVFLNTKVSSLKPVNLVNVPKDSLPSGIIQITLLSADFIPLNERIAFINNASDKISIEPVNLKADYKTREKVDFSFKAHHVNSPVMGSFSMAVTNTTAVKPDPENESNILTGLLLTSDLSGYVEKPNHYFLNDDKKTKEDLDNLLLTQGWRKISYQQVNNDTPLNLTFPAETGLSISGNIMKGKNPVVGGKVSLLTLAKGIMMIDTLTDSKGRFNFDEISFPDSTKFLVQARTNKDKKFVEINIDTVPKQKVTENKNRADLDENVNESIMDYLHQSDKYFQDQTKRGLLSKTILLDEVKIVEKKPLTISSSNLNGPGRADMVIKAKDLENAFSLSQYLQGRIAGVQIRNGLAYARNNTNPMAVYLDGISLGTDGFSLDDIVVQDIETVEVLKSMSYSAIYGMNGSAGVIVITTKTGMGTSSYNRYTPGLISFVPKGFSAIREFYSPKYDVTPDSRPDLRTTVFWDPQVVTDKDGNVSVGYFNTDVAGIYRMVIEGIDIHGNLARKVLTYEVK
ncbi:TonB-dependent receptor [Pedobacter sp.]|uniref:TonB-dependent receptor n=1 Tax=Pedobacter sp. TaxID=1411316 RepID=UPI00396C4B41